MRRLGRGEQGTAAAEPAWVQLYGNVPQLRGKG